MRKRNRELHIQVWVLAALPSFIVEYCLVPILGENLDLY